MKITIDLTTLAPTTLAVLAADLTQQIAGQDNTIDADADAVIEQLYRVAGPDLADFMLQEFNAAADVVDEITSRLVMAGRIS